MAQGLVTPEHVELNSNDETPQVETIEHQELGLIGRFHLREVLGGGGFGNVYRAYDPRLDRDVALKVLKDIHPAPRTMERFFREARAAARLDHPSIIALHDAGREGRQCWIAYQYVPGMNLATHSSLHALTFRAAARVVHGLAVALEHAHERGVFHRDLKPSNVLIDDRGAPRLADFGLAKRLDCISTLTREGTILGTPAYMAPEQAQGMSHLADARSDIYSLGVILYELLCRRRPIEVPSGEPFWRASHIVAVPAPRTIDRAIPRALDRICQRALERNPADRYPDARSMADDLEDWLERPQQVRVAFAALAGAVFASVVLILAFLAFRPASPAKSSVAAPAPTHSSRRHATGLAVANPKTKPAALPVMPQSKPSEAAAKPAPQTGTSAPPSATPPPVSLPDLAPAPAAVDAPLLGNVTSHVYHRSTCMHIGSMRPQNRVEFRTPEEARARGFTPCGHCHPER